MSVKTISAYRVLETLEEKASSKIDADFSLLARKDHYLNFYYIVKADWRDQLARTKKVEVVAEYGSSKDSTDYFVKFWDTRCVKRLACIAAETASQKPLSIDETRYHVSHVM